MEFLEGTDVDVEEDFVEICDGLLPNDDPVQCGSEVCVICNELATEQQPPLFGPCRLWAFCGQTAVSIKMPLGR